MYDIDYLNMRPPIIVHGLMRWNELCKTLRCTSKALARVQYPLLAHPPIQTDKLDNEHRRYNRSVLFGNFLRVNRCNINTFLY